MEDNKFDDILKDKLSSLEKAELHAPDWEQMNKKLQEDSLKDQIFDEQVAHKLESLTASLFVKPQWNNLYDLLKARLERRRMVLISKSSELIIFSLLLLTAFNLGWNIENKPHQEEKPALQYASIEQKNGDLSVPAIETIESINKDEIKEVTNQGSENKLITPDQVSFENEVFANNNIAKQSKNQDLQSHDSKLSFVGNTNNLPNNSSNDNPLTNGVDAHLHQAELLTDNNSVLKQGLISTQTIASSKNNIQNQYNEEVLDRNPFVELKNTVAERNNNASLAHVELIPTKNNKMHYFSLYGNTRFHDIVTKYGKEFRSIRKQNYSVSTNIGMKYEFQFLKRLSNSIGVEYSNVSYNLDLTTTNGSFSDGYVRTSFKSVDFHFISVPIDLNLRLLNRNGWEIRAIGGLSSDILVASKYGLYQTESSDINTLNSLELRPVVPQEINRASALLTKNYQRGIIDEDIIEQNFLDRVKNNIYYKLKGGISIHKKVTPRIAIFTEGNYQYSFERNRSIGPNSDKINVYSVNLGIRYQLNKA